jgi:hypothetical protein
MPFLLLNRLLETWGKRIEMKNRITILCVLLAALAFQSCRSTEDKAKELVKSLVTSNLYNPKSYNEVNSTIDSVFSIDGSLDAAIGFFEVVDILTDNKALIREGEGDVFYSNHDSKTVKKQLGRIKKKIESKMNRYITERYTTEKVKFAGFVITVDYTAKNLSGGDIPGAGIFLVDKAAENIVYAKGFDAIELVEMMMMDKKSKYQVIQDYLDDIHDAGEEFDVDDFISYYLAVD